MAIFCYRLNKLLINHPLTKYYRCSVLKRYQCSFKPLHSSCVIIINVLPDSHHIQTALAVELLLFKEVSSIHNMSCSSRSHVIFNVLISYRWSTFHMLFIAHFFFVLDWDALRLADDRQAGTFPGAGSKPEERCQTDGNNLSTWYAQKKLHTETVSPWYAVSWWRTRGASTEAASAEHLWVHEHEAYKMAGLVKVSVSNNNYFQTIRSALQFYRLTTIDKSLICRIRQVLIRQ